MRVLIPGFRRALPGATRLGRGLILASGLLSSVLAASVAARPGPGQKSFQGAGEGAVLKASGVEARAVMAALPARGTAGHPSPGTMIAGSVPPASAGGNAAASPGRSARNASYTIEATLDPLTRKVTGREILTWRNIQKRPTSELWLHLYWNAWRNNRSTWMLEDRLRGRSDRGQDIKPDDWSYTEVEAIKLLPVAGAEARPAGQHGAPGEGPAASPVEAADLLATAVYAAPDDGNSEDRTVLKVPLPRAVPPGDTIKVEITWHARLPRTFARTGYRGDFFFVAQWFPKLGVYQAAGWNCHQFHAATEFFSDYGVYDVKLTLPANFIVGATGVEQGAPTLSGESATHHFRQADVHDFAWTASPEAVVKEARFSSPGLPEVKMRLLVQPEHMSQVDRYFDATRASLGRYGTWYGAYPYDHITIVDPAYGSGAGGMEYPTLFTGGTRLWNPMGGDSPESVTVHEAGHQFWYALVGNNEFEDAWLDEGFNTFSTLRTLDVVFGARTLMRRYLKPPGKGRGRSGFFPLLLHGVKVDRWLERLNRYRAAAASDDPSTPTYLYHPGTAGDITYSKTALWLETLERTIGWDQLQPIMAAYFKQYRFGHPTPEDFFRVAEEVSGRDLRWFFDQVYRDSVVFDYAVDSVASTATQLKGYRDGEAGAVLVEEEDNDEGTTSGEEKIYRTEVVVRRLGGGLYPVELLMVFEDGQELRFPWDGKKRWKLFMVERPSKLSYAVVDPERKLLLDVNYTNNSRRLEAASRLASLKWGSRWMIWLQDLLWQFAFFG